jgi:hypothetical protein
MKNELKMSSENLKKDCMIEIAGLSNAFKSLDFELKGYFKPLFYPQEVFFK